MLDQDRETANAQKFVAIYCTENTKNKTDTPILPSSPPIAESLSSGHSISQPHIFKKEKKEKTETKPQTNSNKETSMGSLANTFP